MKKVVVSVPAVITVADAGVEYGKPALFASITPRIYVTLIKNNKTTRVTFPFQDHVISIFDKKYGVITSVLVEVNSRLPLENVTSSIIVAIVGGLRLFHNLSWNPSEINEFAHEVEGQFNKGASGAHTSVATYGGLLWYRKEFEFLKTFWLLPFKVPTNFGKFLLVPIHNSLTVILGSLPIRKATPESDSGQARVTKFDLGLGLTPMRSTVQEQIKLEMLVKRLVISIHDEEREAFFKALKTYAKLQRAQGILSTATYKVIEDIEKQGGRGWLVWEQRDGEKKEWVMLVHENGKVLTSLVNKFKHKSIPVSFEAEGIRKEQVII